MHQFKHFSTLPPFHSARIISQKQKKFLEKKIILPLVKMLFKETLKIAIFEKGNFLGN